MYKIEAIIRPDRLSAVKEALVDQGFGEFAITEVHSHGSLPGAMGSYRGVDFDIPYTQQARVELNVPDTSLEAVIDSIVVAARTGKPGDGKIFVTPLAEVIAIRLGRLAVLESRPSPRPRLAAVVEAEWPRG